MVRDSVKAAAAQGRFSLEDVPYASRGRLRNIDDIASNRDATAHLRVLGTAWDNVFSQRVKAPGVNYQLVDKVRHIRNEWGHDDSTFDFGNDVEVSDALRAINDLHRGLSAAGGQVEVRPSPRMTAQARLPATPRAQHRPQSAGSGIDEGALQSLVNNLDQHLERGAQVKQEVENLLTGHPNWHVLQRIRSTLNSFRVQSQELQQRSFTLYQGTPKRQVLVDRENLLAVFLSTLEPLEKLTGELLDNIRKFPDDLKQHAEEGEQIQREVENRLKGPPVLSDLEIVLRRIGRYWLTQDELRSKSSSLYQGSSRPQNVTIAEKRLEDIYPALRELEELVKQREAEQRKAEYPEDLRRHLGEGERIRTDATTILAGRPSLPDLGQILEELDHYWSIQDTLKQKVSGLYGDDAELPLPVRLNKKLIEDLRLPLRRLAV